ncbi:protein tyrosine phosphatase [Arthrobacter bambusae]|uniref:protein tyrosine phosphatase n=1 Tax=Arthrobacter bambusae TaxID=1338426 RepID=UPI00278B7291|nr:protein tyrosine phosphatase [Arthrobacter bambusae]MDQ0212488.1 hypothetical protein [Arthrobacter bambusae]MDQ0236936.1 hypothetical protein [Arthrobacter bambusae]
MSFFTALLTSKIAAGALAAGTLAVGGTAAAAYTGSLPTPLQQSAHNLVGAPAPAPAASAALATPTDTTEATEATEAAEATEKATATDSPSATPVGPDATGPAAYGLCQAFTRGGLDSSSTAYRSLTIAASGASDIAAYCAAVVSPGESASHRPAETGAGAATAHIPADAAGHVPAAPKLPVQAVVPSAPQLPAQEVVPTTPQQAAGTAHKPATAGRP